MDNIIVAFSNPEDGKKIKSILARSGFSVRALCTTASQVLGVCENIKSGILISGFRFPDMLYEELRECLPDSVDLLLLASPSHWTHPAPSGCVYLPMPLKVHELINTLEMMVQAQNRRKRQQRSQPRQRSEEEMQVIQKAKRLLMERNNMTEAQAHRYIQKCSMDSGNDMVETAHMVLQVM
ncbi:MAG: ANTAR domain-containing protein [Lachnospiraceae bacterium]|nr:ANTAR domain-containing protein [Lachnospiraceae bacterium]